MSTSSKRSSHPFVPSPRWLSESPARPPSSTTISPLRRIPKDSPRRFEGLWSPAPPPPANLHAGTPDAFSADPGVPFLATAGSGDSDRGSENDNDESSNQRRFVGSFVTGIKRSLSRRRPGKPALDVDKNVIRDSGYHSTSVVVPEPSQARRSSTEEAVVSHEESSSRRPETSEAMVDQQYTKRRRRTKAGVGIPDERSRQYNRYFDDTMDNYRANFDAVADLQGRLSLFSGSLSVETASIEFGSDYAKMEAPLHDDDSLFAYIIRIKRFIAKISALPFSSKPRVTYDYFPELELRDHPRRRPLLLWHRPGYDPLNYDSPLPDQVHSAAPPSPPTDEGRTIHTPRRVNLDLQEEFDPAPETIYVPNQTPRPIYQAVQGAPKLRPSTNTPTPISGRRVVQRANDLSWKEAVNTTHQSARKRRIATPFHRAVSISEEPVGWQQYPQYRHGYVPPELAEGHYGSRYGPGIHSARPVFAPLHSTPTSIHSNGRQQVATARLTPSS